MYSFAYANRSFLFPTHNDLTQHVIGIGTMWDYAGCVGDQASDYPYLCTKATNVWQNDWGCTGTPPVETDGGGGTAGGHWDEACLINELMTGWVNYGVMPLSKLTAAALDDMGYTINYASPFIDYGYTGANTSCCNGRRNLRTLSDPNGNANHNAHNPPIPEHVLQAVVYGKAVLQKAKVPESQRVTDEGAIYVGDKKTSVFFYSNGDIHTVDVTLNEDADATS